MTELKQYIIYKIEIGGKVYIGSTSNFRNRINGHFTDFRNSHRRNFNIPLYKFIRDNNLHFSKDNFEIIEQVENLFDSNKENKEYAHFLENEYIKLFTDENDESYLLNGVAAYVSGEELKEYKKEWHENNKERITEKRRVWYENNKERITEKNRKRYENKKEEINEKNRKRYEKNKEEISEKQRVWYENNKEKLKEKYNCECGSIIRIDSKVRHERSVKHQQYIINNQKK